MCNNSQGFRLESSKRAGNYKATRHRPIGQEIVALPRHILVGYIMACCTLVQICLLHYQLQ
jgi:hypothetical protein